MEDEEDFISPLDFASLSERARQADVDVKTQIQKYRDLLAEGTRRMREQRIGPSNSEFLLSLAQALGKPTRTGKFGERMALVANTLGGQESARREAELARADMLEKLGLKGAEFELGAAQTRANTLATLMARQMAANKPVRGIAVGDKLVNPYTNQEIQPPVGTKKVYEGRTYEFLGGTDQYDRKNWKEVF
jgi:hypothetical protein